MSTGGSGGLSLGAVGSTAVDVVANLKPMIEGLKTAADKTKSFSERTKAIVQVSTGLTNAGKTLQSLPVANVKVLESTMKKAAEPIKSAGNGLGTIASALSLVGLVASGSIAKFAKIGSGLVSVIAIGIKLTSMVIGIGAAIGGAVLNVGLGVGVAVGLALKAVTSLVTSIVSAVSSIVETIGAIFASVANGIADAMAAVVGAVGGLLSTLGSAFEAAIGMATKLGAALAAAMGAAGFAIFKLVKEASDLNETLNKVDTVFGSAAKTVKKGADEMAKAFGVPRREFLDAASSIGLIAKAAKLSTDAAANLSVKLTKLGADAASFYNVPIEEALIAMRAGLVGESEPMRRFGVLLDEASVAQEALRLGLARTNKELTQADKVQSRASLILKGMADASGDLERTGGELANRMREVGGRIQDLAVTIGGYFLPAGKAFAASLSILVQDIKAFFDRNAETFKAFGDKMATIARVLGLVFRKWPTFAALGMAVLKDATMKTVEVLRRLQIVAQNVFTDIYDYVIDKLGLAGTTTKEIFEKTIPDAARAGFNQIKEAIIASGIPELIMQQLNRILDMAKQAFKDLAVWLSGGGIDELLVDIKLKLEKAVFDGLVEGAKVAFRVIKDLLKQLVHLNAPMPMPDPEMMEWATGKRKSQKESGGGGGGAGPQASNTVPLGGLRNALSENLIGALGNKPENAGGIMRGLPNGLFGSLPTNLSEIQPLMDRLGILAKPEPTRGRGVVVQQRQSAIRQLNALRQQEQMAKIPRDALGQTKKLPGNGMLDFMFLHGNDFNGTEAQAQRILAMRAQRQAKAANRRPRQSLGARAPIGVGGRARKVALRLATKNRVGAGIGAGGGIGAGEQAGFEPEFIGLTDFAKKIQLDALGGKAGDKNAQNTADNTKLMADALTDMKTNGVKIQGGVPAVAGP